MLHSQSLRVFMTDGLPSAGFAGTFSGGCGDGESPFKNNVYGCGYERRITNRGGGWRWHPKVLNS